MKEKRRLRAILTKDFEVETRSGKAATQAVEELVQPALDALGVPWSRDVISILDLDDADEPPLLDPIHPGEILLKEFMEPLGISMNELARCLWVPAGRISEIVNGKRAITADTALRLGRFFSVSPEVWLGMQKNYELRLARRQGWADIEANVKPLERETNNED